MLRKNLNWSEEKFWKTAAFCLLFLYAAVGLMLYDDYGCGPDEGMERQTSLVNLRYVVHKLQIPISEKNETWLAYLPELSEYRDRYYGTALHFPLVLIEAFYNFSLEPSQFYGMRHLYTFINYFIGVICLCRLLTNRFGCRKFGLIGMLMMILTPRFFAESFYNNKDLIFVAWYMICAFLMDRWFRKRDGLSTVLLAFAMALTINTRFNGIIFIPIFIFLFAADSLRCRKTTGFRYFLLVLGLMVLIFYLITPNFWEHPLRTLGETLQFNLRHPNHGSEGNLFKGVPVDAARTLTYIPVWIAITVPPVYLLFSLLGTACYGIDTCRDLIKKRFEALPLTDMMMFISGFLAAGFIIVAHVTIYNGWRHCYFSWPCFIYFAVYCMQKIDSLKLRAAKAVCYTVLGVSLLCNAWWSSRNHPYEFVYFAPFIRNNAGQYSGDYWSITSRALLEYITENDPQRMIKINHAHSQAGSINRGLLPDEQRKFLELTYDEGPDVDYYIVCRDDIPSVDIGLDGYEKVFSITVDRDEIGAVFRKIENIDQR